MRYMDAEQQCAVVPNAPQWRYVSRNLFARPNRDQSMALQIEVCVPPPRFQYGTWQLGTMSCTITSTPSSYILLSVQPRFVDINCQSAPARRHCHQLACLNPTNAGDALLNCFFDWSTVQLIIFGFYVGQHTRLRRSIILSPTL